MATPEHPSRESSSAAIRRGERPVRGSLRRRFLLTLLLMTILPGYVSLLLLSATVTRMLRTDARLETYDKARNLSRELDEALQSCVNAFSTFSTDAAFVESVDEALQAYQFGLASAEVPLGPFDLKIPDNFPRAPLYLVDDKGSILAEVTGAAIVFKYAKPTPIDGSEFLQKLAREMPEGLFVSEPLNQDWHSPVLLLGSVLPTENSSNIRVALVTPIPLMPLFDEVNRRTYDYSESLIVVSKHLGVLCPTDQDELALGLNRIRSMFFEAPVSDEPELTPFQFREQPLGLAHSTSRVVSQLSKKASLEPVDWAVVQTVNLGEALAPIEPMFWTAVIVGLVFTFVTLVLALYISGRMVKPIVTLTEGIQRYAKGELDYRVEVRTRDELQVLASAANDMASSLRASYESLANQNRELDEKASQLEMIHSISYSVNRVLDLERMFARIIKELRRQIPCERISLALLDPRGEQLTLDYVYPGDRDYLPRGSVVSLEDSVMGRALKDQVLTVRRLRKEGKYFEDDILSSLGMTVLCVVPLVATNGGVGCLNLASSDEDCFSQARIKLLERIADSLALAVEHSRLFSRVARFAEELEETVDRRTQELKAAQAKLVQAEKFAATGSIAAHIGHEVNNPLSIIKNYLRLISGRVSHLPDRDGSVEATREGLVVIEEEIDRIARIIGQLRQVSRPSKGEMSLVDLPAEIHKLAELFEGTMRKRGVAIELQIDPTLRTVWACSDYIRQIVINLVRNSMDAMEDNTGGIIIVRTLRGVPDKDSFCVEVEDTGSGIPREDMSKIFDPFFTTKGEGKGTGLGLSVSFGLAQAMGGIMDAESTPGEGTTIRLILPLKTEHGSSDLVKPPEDEAPIRRQGNKIIIG